MHVTYHFTVPYCSQTLHLTFVICRTSLHLTVKTTTTILFDSCIVEYKIHTILQFLIYRKSLQLKNVICRKSLQSPIQITINFVLKRVPPIADFGKV